MNINRTQIYLIIIDALTLLLTYFVKDQFLFMVTGLATFGALTFLIYWFHSDPPKPKLPPTETEEKDEQAPPAQIVTQSPQPTAPKTFEEIVIANLDSAMGTAKAKVDLTATFPINQEITFHGVKGKLEGNLVYEIKATKDATPAQSKPKPLVQKVIED